MKTTIRVLFRAPNGGRSQAQIEAFAENTPRAKLLENSTNITLSGQNSLTINN